MGKICNRRRVLSRAGGEHHAHVTPSGARAMDAAIDDVANGTSEVSAACARRR